MFIYAEQIIHKINLDHMTFQHLPVRSYKQEDELSAKKWTVFISYVFIYVSLVRRTPNDLSSLPKQTLLEWTA